MRVWVISSSYPRHPRESVNAGVIARDLALALADAGHRVGVVTPAKPGGIEFDPEIEGIVLPWLSPSLALADLSGRSPGDVIRMLSLFVMARSRLRRAIGRSRPDATIALWALPSGIFARWVKRMCGAPYAVWVLGSDVWKVDRFPGGRRLFGRVLGDAAAAYADGSELAAEARNLSGREVSFLPSCRRLPPPGGDVPDPVDVLFVGRYHRNKGPDVLLEAFGLLHERRPDATLRLHGHGELGPGIAQRVRELGLERVVDVSGPVSAPELSAAMARAKVLAIPSRIESIPLILGDARQAGLPVVASAVGDLSTVVEPHGLGSTVPPEDPVALADALEKALEQPARLPEGAGPAWLSPEGLADTLLEGLR